MKKALVVGHTGQDGIYLSTLLQGKNYEVTGISRERISENNYGITKLDVLREEQVSDAVKKIQPDEIYFLAAVHQSSSDKQMDDGTLFRKSLDLNLIALVNFLETVRKFAPGCKLFYAASSHVFGSPSVSPQDESTPFQPECIYGVTKTAGVRTCHFYREHHSIFASVGIFYNHESPLRESKYVSKKIVETAAAIKKGLKTELVLGDLESQIDWGYAPDYMRAVYAMMQLPEAGNFVISSGAIHTIKDFVVEVFLQLNLDWTKFVKVDPTLITKKQKKNLFGSSYKIKNATGWFPSVDFKGLTKILVDEEMKKHG